MKKLVLLLALCLQINFSFAQAVKFYAEVDSKEIPLGSYIEVKFILDNSDGKNFKAPSFEGFDIIAGPNRSSSMSIVNGRVSKTQSYSYSLRPKKLGTVSIGQSSIQSSIGKLQTDEITIKVIKAKPRSLDTNESVFIETICSDSITYVGQQIILSYKLYTQLNVQSINFSGQTEYEGFFASDISSNSEATKRELVNGQEYATKIIKRISLFPQQKGYYSIAPTSLILGIASDNNRRSFFFSSQLERKQVLAKGINIEVIDMPSPAPNSYSGAIGNYNMNAELFKRSITTDDAIVITMMVTGDGDSKTVNPPKWLNSDSLEIYDPNILSDEILSKRAKITHRKEFEYLIVPKHPGQYTLKPEFSYFDPDSQDYIKIVKDLPVVNVIAGKTYQNPESQINEIPELGLVQELNLRAPRKKVHGSLIHSMFLISVILISLIITAYSIYLKRIGKTDPIKQRQDKAYRLARERLDKLSNLLSSNTNSQFYLELSRSVKQFINDKFQVPAFHISKTEIIEALKKSSLNDQQIVEFENILHEAETSLYAPGLVKSPEELYKQTLELFAQIES